MTVHRLIRVLDNGIIRVSVLIGRLGSDDGSEERER